MSDYRHGDNRRQSVTERVFSGGRTCFPFTFARQNSIDEAPITAERDSYKLQQPKQKPPMIQMDTKSRMLL